jgi:hypothetical protein
LAPDDWWAAFGDAAVSNEPATTGESRTNGDSSTRQSGDPDPPDGKAA